MTFTVPAARTGCLTRLSSWRSAPTALECGESAMLYQFLYTMTFPLLSTSLFPALSTTVLTPRLALIG